MGLIVPQLDLVSRTLIFDPPLTDEEFEAFCAESDYRIERGERLRFAVGPLEDGCRRKTVYFSDRMVVEINISILRNRKISRRVVQWNQFL